MKRAPVASGRPERAGATELLFRSFHSLKSAARTVGAREFAARAAKLEALFSRPEAAEGWLDSEQIESIERELRLMRGELAQMSTSSSLDSA